jgi:hypothetical protein
MRRRLARYRSELFAAQDGCTKEVKIEQRKQHYAGIF